MPSIKGIFLVGHGPSSSHTIGPEKACDYILEKYPQIKHIKVTLYGSLALTGKGHLTDYIIHLKLKDVSHEVIFNTKRKVMISNTMLFEIFTTDGKRFLETIYSIGGGSIAIKGIKKDLEVEVFPHRHLKNILRYCQDNQLSLVDYVLKFESEDILEYLATIYETMEEAKKRGIMATGKLPGNLRLSRKAHDMYEAALEKKDDPLLYVAVTSFAVAEENAAGGEIAIAPTCGSAGVIPGCITYLQMNGYTKEEIVRGLLVAGLIGDLAKTNASVSGAKCGCQAEIGVASAMGAALISTVLGYSNEKIAQSAEIAMEHSLGLTCDPVQGYVQIPCIERCALFALKAIDASKMASIIPFKYSRVDYDHAVRTMYQTGRDLQKGYRETAQAGLAKIIK